MSEDKRKWVPEIFYEEDHEGVAGNLPFIQVPDGKEMPGLLFIFSSTDTGEFEPGLSGEPVPIVDLELHQYANMTYLKDGLDERSYNVIREVLGLEPMRDAVEKGKAVTTNIRKNLNNQL